MRVLGLVGMGLGKGFVWWGIVWVGLVDFGVCGFWMVFYCTFGGVYGFAIVLMFPFVVVVVV